MAIACHRTTLRLSAVPFHKSLISIQALHEDNAILDSLGGFSYWAPGIFSFFLLIFLVSLSILDSTHDQRPQVSPSRLHRK
jgi:hypothetical protein